MRNNRSRRSVCLQVILLLGIAGGRGDAVAADAADSATPTNPPNVLFILVDDMASWTGYEKGHPDVETPNIDALARQGFAFSEAHVASPICGPSRAALLTGQRTTRTQVYTNQGNYTDYVPDALTLPKAYMDAGYHVMGAGKIIHPTGNVITGQFHDYGPGTGVVGGPFTHDELATANMKPVNVIDRGPGNLKAVLPMNGISTIDRPQNQYSTFDWGPVNIGDDGMPDGQIANWAVEKLDEDYNQPFFLGVGFYRPHQPFFVPQEYFDRFESATVLLPETIAGDLHDVPLPGRQLALGAFTSGTHKTVSEYGQWREAVRGYLATIAFVDRQVGKVLQALRQSPHADNTIVVLWSDHGWHLGEKEHWGKMTAWRTSTRAPMIIVPSGQQPLEAPAGGVIVDTPVSSLDIFPTLLELTGVNIQEPLDGESLVPVMQQPNEYRRGRHVVSTVGRGNHAVQSTGWRYIRYFDGSEELYDMSNDKQEYFNLAGNKEYASVKAKLAAHIQPDRRFQRFVGMGRWKAVFETTGNVQLYDLEAPFGISEHEDVASEHPDVIRQIMDLLDEEGHKARHLRLVPSE